MPPAPGRHVAGRTARIVAALVGLVGVATACSSAGHYGGADIKIPGAPTGAGSLTVKADKPYVLPLGVLCTTGAPVAITSVAASVVSGNMKVVDWGIRLVTPTSSYAPSANGGGVPGRVSQYPGFSPDTKVSANCSDQQNYDQFDVSISTTSTGKIKGVMIQYSDNQKVLSPFVMKLCISKDCPIEFH